MNVKQLLSTTLLFFVAIVPIQAQRSGKMVIQGSECEYDTLVYRHIGPGTTYTQFQFNDIKLNGFSYKMRAHLFTIDKTNQYVSLRPYLSKGTYYSANKQDLEVKRLKEEEGLKPFASVNANAFTQTSYESATSLRYEVAGSLVDNGIVRYSTNSRNKQYYTDSNGSSHIGSLALHAVATNKSGQTAEVAQINHFRDCAGDGKLALFCNGMSRTHSSDNTTGTDVILTLAGEEDVKVGKNNFTVKSIKEGCGNTIENGEAALSGTGAIEDWLKNLSVGDNISIDITYTDSNNNSVSPTSMYTRFDEECIIDGVTQNTSWTNYAISATGVSKDGNTVYLADLEISRYSNAPTKCFEDFLLAVGAWNAMWHDGGPSAEMTVDENYVTISSMGKLFNGRRIPSGVMLFSTAPDDSNLTSVECPDPSARTLLPGEKFTLELYGFNQYGEMIDGNAATNPKVKITCTSGIGTIEGGVFTACESGVGTIDISVDGSGTALQIPITITAYEELKVSPKTIFTGEGRSIAVTDLVYCYGVTETKVKPEQAQWSTNRATVVSSCSNGVITPYMDGYAEVYVTYKDLSDTIDVTVENLEEEGIKYIDMTDQLTEDYNFNLHLPSLPRSFFVETVSDGSESVSIIYTTGGNKNTVVLYSPDGNKTHSNEITLDYDNISTYPVSVDDILPHNSAKITRLVANYTTEPYVPTPTGIKEVERYTEDNTNIVYYNLQGNRVSKNYHGIVITGGKKTVQ